MKKLFSIIMCVLMVMCFMPTAAFAGSEDGGTQVTYSPVYVMNSAGTVIELADGQGLESNEATTATTISGNSYVAKYSGGKLYLKEYDIDVTKKDSEDALYAIKGTKGQDYEIVVEADSSININKTATSGDVAGIYLNWGLLTISGNGKLTINVTGKIANASVYGIYAYKGLVASAPLTINAKSEVLDNACVYGIYASTGAINLSGGDKVINASAKSYTGIGYVLKEGTTDQYEETNVECWGDAKGIYNYSASSAAKYFGLEDNGKVSIACNLKIGSVIEENNNDVEAGGIYTDGDIEMNGANVTISSSKMQKGIQTTRGNIEISNNSRVNVNLTNNSSNGLLAGYEEYSDGLFYKMGKLDIENSTVNVTSGGWAAKIKNVDIKNSNVSFTTTYQYESPILTKDDTANYIDLSGYGRVTLKSCDYQYYEIDKDKFKEEFHEDPMPAYTAGLLNHVMLGSYTYVQTGTTDNNAIENAVRILGTVTDENAPTVTTAVISHLVRHSSSSTITELEKAKAEAKTEVKAKAEANKYDETEATEVKNIKEQADKDITAAKTVEEVNKIKSEAEAKIDAVNTAEENAEIKTISGIDKQVFKAKSKKTTFHGKKAVKVTWKLPSGISVDGFEVYRSTKRYSGFGTEPYFTTTKTSYTNNKDLKSGKTYYYKVRGYKMINGEKVYTGWSTKAYRTI